MKQGKWVILKTGATFADIRRRWGDFEDWVLAYAGLKGDDTVVVDACKHEQLPENQDILGVIITGSHAMMTDASEWIDTAIRWVRQLVEGRVPVLGICFGHQLLATAIGGSVDYHPLGREVGTTDVRLTPSGCQDVLFANLPVVFPAHTTHAQSVLRLPKAAMVLGANAFEPHHALRIDPCAWGVQFHPEFSADVMRAYIDRQSSDLRKEGHDVEVLRSRVVDTPASNNLLKAFVAFAARHLPA